MCRLAYQRASSGLSNILGRPLLFLNRYRSLVYQILLLYTGIENAAGLITGAVELVCDFFDAKFTVEAADSQAQKFLLATTLSNVMTALRHSR